MIREESTRGLLGGISEFRGLQMGVKSGIFGQFVFDVSSSLCVIKKIQWCVITAHLRLPDMHLA